MIFDKNKTYFGLTVYKYGVRHRDVVKLPFYDYWSKVSRGSTETMVDNESYIYLHDWERFCKIFIEHGSKAGEDNGR